MYFLVSGGEISRPTMRWAYTTRGKNVRSCLAILFSLITTLASHIASAAGDDLGVVLLHGKGGSPTGYIRELAFALQGRGYLVSTPTMPWAKNRIYDASFEEAMAEIDREVDALRQKGAKLVVVAGQSLGANAALGYAASRERVGGIIVLAPAHNPELQAFARRVGSDVRRAKAMVAAGKGKEKQAFSDLNQGQALEVTATAEVYLSWFDPDGPAVMPRSAASIKMPTPLLFVIGSGDRTAPAKDYIFDKAPAHAKSKFVTVTADHFTVPTAAIEEVVTWLAALRQ
jgi:pimeloyl-ACP methyl ester carboxylesterase